MPAKVHHHDICGKHKDRGLSFDGFCIVRGCFGCGEDW